VLQLSVNYRSDFRGLLANKLIERANPQTGDGDTGQGGEWFADITQGNLFFKSPLNPMPWDVERSSHIVAIKYLVKDRINLSLDPPVTKQIQALPWKDVQRAYWSHAPIGEIESPTSIKTVLRWASEHDEGWAKTLNLLRTHRRDTVTRIARQSILNRVPFSCTYSELKKYKTTILKESA